MKSVSHGKPCAGNPHARFEEGASASKTPRRSALLHKFEEYFSFEAILGDLVRWRIRVKDVGEKEKANRTKFAQRILKPESVLPEWKKVETAFGSVEDVRTFTKGALAELGFHTLSSLPPQIVHRLQENGAELPQDLRYDDLTRAHPLVASLAGYVLESALYPVDEKPIAARSGVAVSREVERVTRIFLLRLRHRLVGRVPGASGTGVPQRPHRRGNFRPCRDTCSESNNLLSTPLAFPVILAPHTIGLDESNPRFHGWGLSDASRSATRFVQEFPNERDDFLWAIVTNGRELRLVRDNPSLTHPSFLSFDLTAILSGSGDFPAFAFLWRMLHSSRIDISTGLTGFTRLNDNPDNSVNPVKNFSAENSVWEKLHTRSAETGVRALDGLRPGVAAAIEILGTGFIRQNPTIREALQNGSFPTFTTPSNSLSSPLANRSRLISHSSIGRWQAYPMSAVTLRSRWKILRLSTPIHSPLRSSVPKLTQNSPKRYIAKLAFSGTKQGMAETLGGFLSALSSTCRMIPRSSSPHQMKNLPQRAQRPQRKS